jgi:hypothetical protein
MLTANITDDIYASDKLVLLTSADQLQCCVQCA